MRRAPDRRDLTREFRGRHQELTWPPGPALPETGPPGPGLPDPSAGPCRRHACRGRRWGSKLVSQRACVPGPSEAIRRTHRGRRRVLHRGGPRVLRVAGPNGAERRPRSPSSAAYSRPMGAKFASTGSRADRSKRRRSSGYVPQDLGPLPGPFRPREPPVLRISSTHWGASGWNDASPRPGAGGLADRGKERIRHLFGGMKPSGPNITSAGLLHEPRLLILDEPTVGVDPQSRYAILETVAGLGIAVLYTTRYTFEGEGEALPKEAWRRLIGRNDPSRELTLRGARIRLRRPGDLGRRARRPDGPVLRDPVPDGAGRTPPRGNR